MQSINHVSSLSFSQTDILWLTFCVVLLVFLQAGLSSMEAGAVRCKNNINVAMKNCLNFGVSVPCFLFLGFPLMFAAPQNFFGVSDSILTHAESDIVPVLMVGLMLSVTTVTIISGAVVERISLCGLMIVSTMTSILFFPLIGRWIWGGDIYNGTPGWLADLGFYDFAGATLVHSVAGWIALASVLIVGPRIGRFGKDAHAITASSLPLMVLGVFLIWIGFMGLVGASALKFERSILLLIMNLILAGIMAMSSAALLCRVKYNNLPVQTILNAGLGGLVAISGCLDSVVLWQAMIVGLVAGLLVVFSGQWLAKLQIDEGIGVISVHLVSGIWGTLATGLFYPVTLPFDRVYLVAVQLLGIVSVGVVVFGGSFIILKLLSVRIQFRVSKAAEMVGLNVWEHGASTSRLDLLQQLSYQASSGDFSKAVSVEPQTEDHQIAWFYNSVREKFNVLQSQKQSALDEAVWLSQHDPLTSIYNRRAAYEMLEREHERVKRTGIHSFVAMLDIDHFKRINDSHGHDIGDEILQQFSQLAASQIRKLDLLARIGGEEFLIVLVDTSLVAAIDKLEQLRNAVMSAPFKTDGLLVGYTISIGLAELSKDLSVEETLKSVDAQLYHAKRSGRNCLKVVQPQCQAV